MKTIRTVFSRNLELLMLEAQRKGKMTHSSAKQLEEVSGVSDSAINNYRAGKRAINLDHLAAIAGAYGLQPWELLHPEFDPAAPPAEQVETLLQMAETSIEDRRLALSRLRGAHGKPASNGHQVDGGAANEVPASGPGSPPKLSGPETRRRR